LPNTSLRACRTCPIIKPRVRHCFRACCAVCARMRHNGAASPQNCRCQDAPAARRACLRDARPQWRSANSAVNALPNDASRYHLATLPAPRYDARARMNNAGSTSADLRLCRARITPGRVPSRRDRLMAWARATILTSGRRGLLCAARIPAHPRDRISSLLYLLAFGG